MDLFKWMGAGSSHQRSSISPQAGGVKQISHADYKQFGLENFGNTCYANSVLQALYFCQPFRELVCDSHDRSNPPIPPIPPIPPAPSPPAPSSPSRPPGLKGFRRRDSTADGGKTAEDSLSNGHAAGQPNSVAAGSAPPIPVTPPTLFSALRSLFLHIALNPADKGTVSPTSFINKLKKENELYRSTMHQDAHEFLGFLLNKIVEDLEAEMKKGAETNGDDVSSSVDSSASTSTPSTSTSTTSPSQSNPSDSQSHPQTTTKTFVHSLFEGTLTSETRCLTCKTVSSRDESFLDLSIDIEQNSSVTACLRQFSASEMLSQKNMFFCDSCEGLQEAEKRMKIKTLPNVLALHLKRFKYQEDSQRYIKLSYRVAFPFELRLFNTVDDAPNPDRLYQLFAIVVHIGGGPHHGHYIAIVKAHGTWFTFDDDTVEAIREGDIPKYFGESPGGAGYVLFYQAVDLDLASLGIDDTEEDAPLPDAEVGGVVAPAAEQPPSGDTEKENGHVVSTARLSARHSKVEVPIVSDPEPQSAVPTVVVPSVASSSTPMVVPSTPATAEPSITSSTTAMAPSATATTPSVASSATMATSPATPSANTVTPSAAASASTAAVNGHSSPGFFRTLRHSQSVKMNGSSDRERDKRQASSSDQRGSDGDGKGSVDAVPPVPWTVLGSPLTHSRSLKLKDKDKDKDRDAVGKWFSSRKKDKRDKRSSSAFPVPVPPLPVLDLSSIPPPGRAGFDLVEPSTPQGKSSAPTDEEAEVRLPRRPTAFRSSMSSIPQPPRSPVPTPLSSHTPRPLPSHGLSKTPVSPTTANAPKSPSRPSTSPSSLPSPWSSRPVAHSSDHNEPYAASEYVRSAPPIPVSFVPPVPPIPVSPVSHGPVSPVRQVPVSAIPPVPPVPLSHSRSHRSSHNVKPSLSPVTTTATSPVPVPVPHSRTHGRRVSQGTNSPSSPTMMTAAAAATTDIPDPPSAVATLKRTSTTISPERMTTISTTTTTTTTTTVPERPSTASSKSKRASRKLSMTAITFPGIFGGGRKEKERAAEKAEREMLLALPPPSSPSVNVRRSQSAAVASSVP